MGDARLEEAKVTREKILRFLIDGEAWIMESKSNENCPARWGEEEHDLMKTTNHHNRLCHRAIMGLVSLHSDDKISEENSGRSDIDGSIYLRSILSIAECGNKYITSNKPGQHPIEALKLVIADLREHLSLVGFSDCTVRAGANNTNSSESSIAGGEGAIVDEFWGFRTKLREAALAAIRNGERTAEHELSRTVLSICDDVRDNILPSIGVEMSDSNETKWKFCIPRQDSSPSLPTVNKKSVSPTGDGNIFTIGNYSGMYSKYDAQGIPTHNSDGTEVSKRLRKKLIRKK